jgi:hypothetical protein
MRFGMAKAAVAFITRNILIFLAKKVKFKLKGSYAQHIPPQQEQAPVPPA